MTNEKWFCNLSTHEKAMVIAAQGKYNTSENMQRMLCGTAEGIEKWLRSEHIETVMSIEEDLDESIKA